jgi:hypothetical protein
MQKYNKQEIVVLSRKLSNCLYSWNREFAVSLRAGTECGKAGKFVSDYYIEQFLYGMSELYTFFYERKDEAILNQFNASEHERLKLRKVRHSIAHMEGDIEKVKKDLREYFLAREPGNQDKDLFLMIKHVRKVAVSLEMEKHIIGELMMVQNMFPPEFLKEQMRKDIFG